MKKVLYSLSIALLSAGVVSAQEKGHHHDHSGHDHPPVTAVNAVAKSDNTIRFTADAHNFGNLQEGPSATHEFTFTNVGKEPILIQRVQASCGCTTPSYSKEPIAPGKTGNITAAYNTSGRPGAFTKTLTVYYNVGNNTSSVTKTLTISGNVEKAPSSSVPESGSMMKMN